MNEMRKMKRWKKVTLWIASIVVVLGIGGVFVADYAVNKVIGSLADSLAPDLTTDSITDVSLEDPSEVKTDINDADTVSIGADQKPVDGKSEVTGNDKGNNPVKELPSKNNNTKPNENLNGYSAEVSVEKAKKIQGSVSIKDKASVTSILIGSLSMSDLKKLQKLAGGGLSQEEKKEARTIILKEVSPEQYNKLSSIAKKYGVSEGKKYDEIVEGK